MQNLGYKVFRAHNFGYLFFVSYFVLKIPNNTTGLNDAYQFRQTQTAWGIREVLRNGHSFFELRMPVLGFPYQVPFEFPLFQNIAGLIGSLLNMEEVQSGRLVSLFFFCAGGIVAFKLIERLTSSSISIFCIALFYLTPFAIQWSNSVLIESLSSFLLIVSSYLLRLYLERASVHTLLFFTFTLALSALVKVTTAFPLIIFLALILSWGIDLKGKRLPLVYLSLSVFISIVPTILWTFFADSVKRNSALTNWLTSESLRNWNFGTFSQRLNEMDYVYIAARFWLLGGIALLMLFPILLILNVKITNFWKLTLISIVPFISPLTYFNLYVVHDYYFLAVLFPSLLALAMLLKFTLDRYVFRTDVYSFISCILIFLAPSWIFVIQNRDYKSLINSDRSIIPPLSSEINKFTNFDDRIFVVGCDWDPTVLFYADRYGIAAPGWIGSTESALDFLDEQKLVDAPKFLAICGANLAPDKEKRLNLTQVSSHLWKINDNP